MDLPAEIDDSEQISVQNELTFIDILNVRSIKYGVVARLAMFAVLGAFVGFAFSLQFEEVWIKAAFICFCALNTVGLELFAAWSIYKRSKKNTNAKFTLCRDHIDVITSEGMGSKVDWKRVKKIEQHGTNIAIQISQKPDTYFWIPRHRFRSNAEADRFLEKANDYWSHWLMSASLEDRAPKGDEPTDEYSVDVDITMKELIICNMHLFRMIVICGLIIFAAGIEQLVIGDLFGLITLLSGVILTTLPAIVSYKRATTHPEYLKARTSINAKGIRPRSDVAGLENMLSWESIKHVYERYGLIFIELQNRAAIIVPMRCFETKEAADQFLSIAQNRWAEHKKQILLEKK